MKRISILILFVLVSVFSYGQNIRGNSLWTRTTVGHDTSYTATGSEDVGDIYWDSQDRTISVPLGNGVVMQVNQETLTEVYNATSDTIFNGKVCFGTGISNDLVSVSLASKTGRYAALLMSTEDILPNMRGMGVSLVGKVRGINTGSLTLGPVYLDTLGNLTNTTPQFPNYSYLVGVVLKTGVTDGIIQFKSDGVNFYNSIRNIMDGSIRETFDFRTFSNGTNTYGVLSDPTGDTALTLVFSTGWFDHVVPDTVLMTDGSATDPQLNYVYIDEATKTLQVSTSSFPVLEHAKVSTSALLTSTRTQADGALRNQNINDHFKSDDDNGHILHMAERIRVLDAAWETGGAPTLTGTPTNLYFQTTSAEVWQMHKQTFPAQDMSTGDDVHVVNDPTTPYRTTTNLNDITAFSDGTAWNNEWSNLVLWGVCNKTGEVSHIMVNLPSDGYQQEESAIADALNYSNYTIPREFRGVGFLIGRFTIRRSGTNFTYNSSTGFLDLRGFVPNTTAGGGAGGSTPITEWIQLNDIPNSYTGFGDAIVTIASAETGAEFTPRSSINLSDFNNDSGYLTSLEPATIDSVTFSNDTLTITEGGVDYKAEIVSAGGGVNSVISGGGMDFQTITSSDSVKLGTPSTITQSSANEVTETSHTHEFDNTGQLFAGRLVVSDPILTNDDYTIVLNNNAIDTLYMPPTSPDGQVFVIVHRGSSSVKIRNSTNTADISYFLLSSIGAGTTFLPANISTRLQKISGGWYRTNR